MRCSQPQGLPSEAIAFLEEKAIRINLCLHCGRDDGYMKKEIGVTGMFDDVFLYEYNLKNGDIAVEYVQQEIWSSGPMIWFGLKIGNKKFEWKKEDIVEV